MIRVVKLGGSLLTRANLVADLRCWLHSQRVSQANLYVVGGGQLINALRELDQIHAFANQDMHWRCVDLLRVTFELMAELMPHWSAIRTAGDFESTLASNAFSGHQLLSVDTFFSPRNDGALSPSWATTTDSIAAFLAHRVGAAELVILKSCPINATWSPTDAVQAGVLDLQFPAASAGIPSVRIEHLPHAVRQSQPQPNG